MPRLPVDRRLAVLEAALLAAVGLAVAVEVLVRPASGTVPVAVLAGLLVLLSVHQVRTAKHLGALAASLETRVRERTAAVATRERWFEALVQNGPDVVTVLDLDGVVTWQSASAGHLLDRRLVGRHVLEVVHASDRPRARRMLERCLAGEQDHLVGSFRFEAAGGRTVHVEAVVRSLLADPDLHGVVLTTRDVSERVELERQLARLAYRDPVTGLPNRRLFVDRVELALAARARDGRLVAVLFCDLDGFKAVNDTLGHHRGDEVLRAVAKRFSAVVRPGDTVARVGGDEFAVLLSPIDTPEEAELVAHRLLAALADPVLAGGTPSRVGASIGIAATEDGEASVDALLGNADLAMYRAKSRGGRRSYRYEPILPPGAGHRAELEHGLRQALEQGELVVHYQVLVEASSGAIHGVEALARWQRGDRLVLPAEFVPLAEETGAIVPIGTFVLAEACRCGAAWQAFGPLDVSVNVSARQLAPELVETVRAVLAETGLPARRLVLELTERSLVDKADGTVEVVAALQELGVTVAVDEFGTGLSSLASLSTLPVDALKVDRSFVSRLDTPDGAAVVGAVVALARTLGLKVLAEGVEEASQRDALVALGVPVLQGFLFGRPVPAAAIDELLAAGRAAATRGGGPNGP